MESESASRKHPRKKAGRRNIFSRAVFDQICDHVARGGWLEPYLLGNPELPTPDTFYRWLHGSAELSEAYAHACDCGDVVLLKEGMDILDNSTPENAQVDKNRAGYRQWIVERRSKKWRAQQAVELSGGDAPVKVEASVAVNADLAAPVLKVLDEIRKRRAAEESEGE